VRVCRSACSACLDGRRGLRVSVGGGDGGCCGLLYCRWFRVWRPRVPEDSSSELGMAGGVVCGDGRVFCGVTCD
jgi:hypothetical protein